MGITKEQFLQPIALKVEKFLVEELNDYVHLQALSAKDLQYFQEHYKPGSADADFKFIFDVLWRSVVNDKGMHLFDSLEEAAKTSWSYDLLTKMVKKVLSISGLTEEKN
jgi:hypothetical protein